MEVADLFLYSDSPPEGDFKLYNSIRSRILLEPISTKITPFAWCHLPFFHDMRRIMTLKAWRPSSPSWRAPHRDFTSCGEAKRARNLGETPNTAASSALPVLLHFTSCLVVRDRAYECGTGFNLSPFVASLCPCTALLQPHLWRCAPADEHTGPLNCGYMCKLKSNAKFSKLMIVFFIFPLTIIIFSSADRTQ